jgi:hypothetical protein
MMSAHLPVYCFWQAPSYLDGYLEAENECHLSHVSIKLDALKNAWDIPGKRLESLNRNISANSGK